MVGEPLLLPLERSKRLLGPDRAAGASLRFLLWADDDFIIAEPKYALKLYLRRGASGTDEVTNKALKKSGCRVPYSAFRQLHGHLTVEGDTS